MGRYRGVGGVTIGGLRGEDTMGSGGATGFGGIYCGAGAGAGFGAGIGGFV